MGRKDRLPRAPCGILPIGVVDSRPFTFFVCKSGNICKPHIILFLSRFIAAVSRGRRRGPASRPWTWVLAPRRRAWRNTWQ